MKLCEQSSGQTILEHGLSVYKKFLELKNNTINWKLPTWYVDNKDWLFSNLPPDETIRLYMIFHDAGKPTCEKIDQYGKKHFPGHALISAQEWLIAGGSKEIARLIEHDMDMHTLKATHVTNYKHLDIVPMLLISALCELHANAAMFGGIESISFKIKFKALSKLGIAFIKIIKE